MGDLQLDDFGSKTSNNGAVFSIPTSETTSTSLTSEHLREHDHANPGQPPSTPTLKFSGASILEFSIPNSSNVPVSDDPRTFEGSDVGHCSISSPSVSPSSTRSNPYKSLETSPPVHLSPSISPPLIRVDLHGGCKNSISTPSVSPSSTRSTPYVGFDIPLATSNHRVPEPQAAPILIPLEHEEFDEDFAARFAAMNKEAIEAALPSSLPERQHAATAATMNQSQSRLTWDQLFSSSGAGPPCTNCGQRGHIADICPLDCMICGGKHHTLDCWINAIQCVNCGFPGHHFAVCGARCNRCNSPEHKGPYCRSATSKGSDFR